MSKIIAIDFGERRIGLAITDETKTISFPYRVLQAGKTLSDSAKKLAKLIYDEKLQIEKIIIGLPLLLSGKESEMSTKVQEFGKLLENELEIPVEYFDERLTSKAADASMREMKLSRKKRTKNLDTISAVLILQTYLASQK